VVAIVVPANREEMVIKPIKNMAQENGIPVFAPPTLKDRGFRESVSAAQSDVFIVDSYTKLIPKDVITIPRLGAFNFHPGKLPQYRGAHVLNWAIINGEGKITLTVHEMNEKFDCGDIAMEEDIDVSFLDDIGSVFGRVAGTGEGMIKKLIEDIKNNRLSLTPQTEEGAKHYRARIPADGRINWKNTGLQIYNLVRALLPPWPCAFFEHRGQEVKIYKAYPVPVGYEEQPGKVVSVSDRAFCVAAGKDWLLVKDADKMDFEAGEIL
jgi:methionyl-tRNA formyltransferase